MKELRLVIIEIEKHKKEIGKSRDKLRAIYCDLDNFLETIDQGDDSLTEAQVYLQEAIDTYSQQI